MSDAITYNQFFQAAADGLTLGPDRHPKWQRVEPGTVVPAGMPYMIEYEGQHPQGVMRSERCHHASHQLGWYNTATEEWCLGSLSHEAAYFIDSSWKPPLVLPTEPTWGILLHTSPDTQSPKVGRLGPGTAHGWFAGMSVKQVIDFIPLTDEQVQRIEAAR